MSTKTKNTILGFLWEILCFILRINPSITKITGDFVEEGLSTFRLKLYLEWYAEHPDFDEIKDDLIGILTNKIKKNFEEGRKELSAQKMEQATTELKSLCGLLGVDIIQYTCLSRLNKEYFDYYQNFIKDSKDLKKALGISEG